MTKKDYERIAGILYLYGKNRDIPVLVNMFTTALQETNPRFDSVKFRIACTTGAIVE